MNLQGFNKQFSFLANITQKQEQNIQNYHKLMKMKKCLIDTQNKMFNRIKLFQKASQKVLKKKQQQMKASQKLQCIKKDPTFSRTRPKTRQSAQRSKSGQFNLKKTRSGQNFYQSLIPNQGSSITAQPHSPRRPFAQRLNLTRLQNAELIKQDRQRNKIIIQERKNKQLRRKLQSATLARRQRQQAKVMKDQCLREKREDFRRLMQEKYSREKQELGRIQARMQGLQERERQALVAWKRTAG